MADAMAQPVQTLPQPQATGEEPEVKGFMTLNEIALKMVMDYMLKCNVPPAGGTSSDMSQTG